MRWRSPSLSGHGMFGRGSFLDRLKMSESAGDRFAFLHLEDSVILSFVKCWRELGDKAMMNSRFAFVAGGL